MDFAVARCSNGGLKTESVLSTKDAYSLIALSLTMRIGVLHFWVLAAMSLVFTCHLFGQVTLTEFMATGNTVIADEDGDYPDWIEVHNGGTNAVNLDGWFLTDNVDRAHQMAIPVRQFWLRTATWSFSLRARIA